MANEIDYPARIVLESGGPDGYLLEDSSGIIIKEIQNYGELVLQDGAICYFRFNEASGNFTDLVGSRIGTPTGTVFTYSATGPLVGDSDTAITLSTNDPYVAVTGDTALGPAAHSNNLTIEGWVQPSSAAVGDVGYFAYLNSAAGTIYRVGILRPSTSQVGLSISAGNAAAGTLLNISDGFSGLTADWHHIAVVFDGTAAATNLYCDARLSTSSPKAWTGVPLGWTTQTLAIGNDTLGGSLVKGSIDEFAIYPTALTADQIARHYRCGIQYFDNGIGMTEPSQYPQLLAQ